MFNIKVGTCGYSYYRPPEGWKDRYESKLQAYSDVFEVGEINRTFYKLPMVKTAERWRREVYDDFEFTLKAWQAVTHPTSSPTWRGNKDKLTKKQENNFGYLRPNDEVVDAWEQTKERAEALESRVCVIQTSAGFECTEENEANMRTLLSRIDRGGLDIAWEPRGNWKDNPDRIKEVCRDLDLIHVVDIMRYEPLSDHSVAYIRLHGLNPDEYDYNYDYSDKELEDLVSRLRNLAEDHTRVYCMFNNYEMFSNAQKLREKLHSKE